MFLSFVADTYAMQQTAFQVVTQQQNIQRVEKMSWVTAILTLIRRVVDKLCLLFTRNFSMSNCLNDGLIRATGKRKREREIVAGEVCLTAQTAHAAAVALLLRAWEPISLSAWQNLIRTRIRNRSSFWNSNVACYQQAAMQLFQFRSQS